MSAVATATELDEPPLPASTAVPSWMSGLIGVAPLRGHAVLLCVATDVDEAGNAAEQWLIATERELAVLIDGDSLRGVRPRCLRSFPLHQVEGCRTQAEVGSGYLQVKQGQVWVDVVRFSNRLAPRFREICNRIEQLRRHHEFAVDEPLEAVFQCPKCGGALRARGVPCPRCAPSVQTLARVVRLLKPYWGTMSIIAGLCVFAVAIELVPPWLQKLLVDDVLSPDGKATPPSFLYTLGGIVTGLAVVRLIAAGISVWKAKLSSEIGTRLTADLRTQMVEKLQRLSVSYHDKNQVGMLMSRVSYDTEAMHTFMHQISGGFLLQVLQLIAIGVMLFVLNPKLAFYTLLPMPLVLLTSWFFCRCLYTRHHRYWDAVGRQASALTSLLSGIRVVKSFTQEPREQEKFRGASERLRESRVGVDLVTATFSSLIGFLFGLGGLVVWYVGGRDVLGDQMTLGSLMAFLAYLSMFYAPLTTVSEGMTWISSFLSASHRIFDLLDTPVSVEEPKSAPVQPQDLKGHIRFDQVTFSYDEKKPALDNVSFEARPGEFLGIVGRSGSGKSTLVCLISRLYDVDSGAVTIDGIDVRQLGSQYLRRRVGMVLQEPFLFEGTVAANIAYGDPAAAPDRIIAAAKAASAHDFILRLPFGYETPLGERGAGLSGGERQRVSIARAILYNPQILILDEATSSIDTESERLIQRAVERLASGRTTLAIAHRLSTLENADRLIVMDQGHIVEEGTHRTLLEQDGLYARLVRRQFGGLVANGSLQLLLGGDDQTSFDTATAVLDEDNTASMPDDEPDWEVRWLNPGEVKFFSGPHGVLSLRCNDREVHGVTTVRAFPATHSDEFLSIRITDANGRDSEFGMIRMLNEWPGESQELIRRALNRRYLLRVIHSLASVKQDNGFVTCEAATDHGDVEFVVHNNPHSVKRFGYNGRLITDLDDNHYLVPNVDELPFLQRRLFKLHFPEI